MIRDFPNSPEPPKKQYAEQVFDRLPEVEAGVDIQRVYVEGLATGRKTRIKLDTADRLGREGWDHKQILGCRPGFPLQNRSGEVFKVVAVNNKDKTVKIENAEEESGEEETIFVSPRVMEADEYEYKLHGPDKSSKKIKVYDTLFARRSQQAKLRTTEFLSAIIRAIPADCMDIISEIQIHRLNKASGAFKPEPSLSSKAGVINLYVNGDLIYEDGDLPTKEVVEILYHEIGHAIAQYILKTVNPGLKWRRAMEADGNEMSEYSSKTRYPNKNDKGEIEDFAEAVRMYLATDGARTSQASRLREFCGNRFVKLDEVFGANGQLNKLAHKSSLTKAFFRRPESL